jgi:hypothetical protein
MVCHGRCHGNSSFIEDIAFYFFVYREIPLIAFFLFRALGYLKEQNSPFNMGVPLSNLRTVCPDHVLVY